MKIDPERLGPFAMDTLSELLLDEKAIDGTIDVPDERLHKLRGLGDIVAAVAQPIAGAIDAVLGTNIQNCGGCADRREALNNLLPFQ